MSGRQRVDIQGTDPDRKVPVLYRTVPDVKINLNTYVCVITYVSER